MAGGASFSSQSRGFLHIFMDMNLFLEPLSFVSRAFLLIPSLPKGGILASPFIKGNFLYVISHLIELFVNYFFGNISIIPGIPTQSLFCKEGLRDFEIEFLIFEILSTLCE